MNESEKKLLKKRNEMAEKLGEGAWVNKETKELCHTDVTFYPKTKLWITEGGERRLISKNELEDKYKKLEI